jgi:Tfp pilus assembly ATPase PilU
LEILKVTHAVANLIREGKTAQIISSLQAGGEEGMLLLEKHLAELVRLRAISLETAQDAANDASTLKQYLPRTCSNHRASRNPDRRATCKSIRCRQEPLAAILEADRPRFCTTVTACPFT